MTPQTEEQAKQLRWQAGVKRACLYMLGIPALAFAAMVMGHNPVTILIGTGIAVLLFIAGLLWTYTRL